MAIIAQSPTFKTLFVLNPIFYLFTGRALTQTIDPRVGGRLMKKYYVSSIVGGDGHAGTSKNAPLTSPHATEALVQPSDTVMNCTYTGASYRNVSTIPKVHQLALQHIVRLRYGGRVGDRRSSMLGRQSPD
jgi:hypothetical protein